MDNLPIGLAVNSVDPSLSFEYMNDKFPEIYGTTKAALEKADSFWDAVYEDPIYREEIKTKILDDIKSGDPERLLWEDVMIKRKGKKTRYIWAQNTPITQQIAHDFEWCGMSPKEKTQRLICAKAKRNSDQ
jgi:hypothetical protein